MAAQDVGVPLTKTCPECQQEMELITADDVGEIFVYECAECGYQDETRVEADAEPEDLGLSPADFVEVELEADPEALESQTDPEPLLPEEDEE